ncbi:MAG: alpha/beta hydrolase [Bacteroidales bacterium]|nr:alpha/beta hydrolase [Bacteroidales bacterium]
MFRKLVTLSILIFTFTACINQKFTQSDVFNPTKEFELTENFTFKRYYIPSSDTSRLESWYLSETNAQINLIYLSGNASNIRSAIPFFNELGRQLDLNIFSFNYRGYGLSDGTPSIDGIIEDGDIALDFFKDEIGNKDLPTIILGYSLGGFVALNMIKKDIVNSGVILSSFSSLEELQAYLLKEALPGIIRPFLKLEIDESIYKLDNNSLVKHNTKPILFIHGESDDFIPPSMSYTLHNLSPSAKKDIKIIEKADHRMVLKNFVSNKLVVSEIKNFIRTE